MYTELAPRRQQFHVAPAMQQLNSAATTLVDIQNELCKAAQSPSQSRIRLERSVSAQKQWI